MAIIFKNWSCNFLCETTYPRKQSKSGNKLYAWKYSSNPIYNVGKMRKRPNVQKQRNVQEIIFYRTLCIF